MRLAGIGVKMGAAMTMEIRQNEVEEYSERLDSDDDGAKNCIKL
jgi:hypothetical protein